eukprot:gene12040-25231_t
MKSVSQIRRANHEKSFIVKSASEKNIAEATQYLHDLANSGVHRLKDISTELKGEQEMLQIKILEAAKRVDQITEETVIINKELSNIDKMVQILPSVSHWIVNTSAQIHSIKHQAKFLESSLDQIDKLKKTSSVPSVDSIRAKNFTNDNIKSTNDTSSDASIPINDDAL